MYVCILIYDIYIYWSPCFYIFAPHCLPIHRSITHRHLSGTQEASARSARVCAVPGTWKLDMKIEMPSWLEAFSPQVLFIDNHMIVRYRVASSWYVFFRTRALFLMAHLQKKTCNVRHLKASLPCMTAGYRVAKMHRMSYMFETSFSTKEPYIWWLIRGKRPAI